MTEPMKLGSRLNDVLAELENLIVNDARAAEHDRIVREAQEVDKRRLRADRLAALDIELTADVHPKVVGDTGMLQTTSLRTVQRWLYRSDLPPTLVLVGNHGCGKSVASAWAVANFSQSSCWYSANDLVRIFAPTFGEALREAQRDQKRVKRAKLAVLDDITTEGDAPRMCSLLIEILENRKQRKTLITTNNSLEDWKQRYPDPRLHSRLAQQAIFVADTGRDLRVAPEAP